jgi:histidine triad (HIT) family protein
MPKYPCVFCEILEGKAPAKIEHEWPDAIAIHTIKPKVEGHLLVIPRKHVQDANEDPETAARVMRRAAEIAKPPSHIHTNLGGAAAQTVFHLHYHIIPRVPNQEVRLSWFKPWDRHPLDRNCDQKSTLREKLGLSFSMELRVMSKTLSTKTEVSLTKSTTK